jgi:mono/diheme cytochrome c family protein
MNKFLKFLGYAVLVLLILAVAGISATIGWRPFLGPKTRPLTNRKFEATPERLARGTYLVEHVTACIDCHTPFDEKTGSSAGNVKEKGSGQPFPLPGFPGSLVAPNITPDPETGIGKWTDDEIARAIREGVTREGHTIFPLMPYSFFHSLSDEDVAAIVVYLRALPPVKKSLPASVVNFPVNHLVNNAPQPITGAVQPDLSTQVKRGEYLAQIAACADCHTPLKHNQLDLQMRFAGGQVFDEPGGKVTSANITPDATGIGNYTEESFVKTLHTGYVGPRALNTLMPWQFYTGMTDDDLKAIYAYLKTVPPITHKVSNQKPPTLCKKCGAQHGAGDEN